MCGILGEFGSSRADSNAFRSLLSMSEHRGPDDSRVETVSERVRFGFNRLAIQDTSDRGGQPVHSPSGRYWIVFNGEIYNWRALLDRYSVDRQALQSGSDVEVLRHLCERVPIPTLLGQLNGMFAIAIYDQVSTTLTLCRDAGGIKPLFYARSSDVVVFASQFDQLFRHPSFAGNLVVDPQALYDCCALGYMVPKRTVFRGMRQCLPGEWIQFNERLEESSGRLRTFEGAVGRPEAKEAAASELDQVRNALKEAVRDQLVADVPVGVFLSGGVDSPLIASYAHALDARVVAYTVGVDDPTSDETELAAAYAKQIGISHRIIRVSESELLNSLEPHFEGLTEPFGDYSSLPTYMVTLAARHDCAVMLSGDGGDELFWGYPRMMRTAHYAPWFRFSRGIRRAAVWSARSLGRKPSYGVTDFDSVSEWALAQQCHNDARSLSRWLPGLSFSDDVLSVYREEQPLVDEMQSLDWLRCVEFNGHLQRVLAKVDRMSMRNSLEVRVPFLDQRVIELAKSLRPNPSVLNASPKDLLKRLLQDEMGDHPINQAKMGFTVPIQSWLRGPLREHLFSLVMETPLFGGELWDVSSVHRHVERFLRGDENGAWGVWHIFALQWWAKRYRLI